MEKLPPNMEDYEATRRNFRLDVPEHFNFGLDVMDRWAEDRTKLALISVSPDGQQAEKHTFWELKVASNRFANVLRGVGRGQGRPGAKLCSHAFPSGTSPS